MAEIIILYGQQMELAIIGQKSLMVNMQPQHNSVQN